MYPSPLFTDGDRAPVIGMTEKHKNKLQKMHSRLLEDIDQPGAIADHLYSKGKSIIL